jgi:hypothetical protein
MDHPPKVSSAKKQAYDAKHLAKLLLRIDTNLKACEAESKGNLKIGKPAA